MMEREPIERWKDRTGAGGLEERAGVLFESVRPRELTARERSGVWARLETGRGARAGVRVLRIAVVTSALLVGGLAAAAGIVLGPQRALEWVRGQEQAPEGSPRVAARETPSAPAVAPQPEVSSAQPETKLEDEKNHPDSTPGSVSDSLSGSLSGSGSASPSAIARRARRELEAPVTARPGASAPIDVRPAPAAPSPASVLALETALVREALAALSRSDARGALAALDRHAAEFPRGVLRSEAAIARVRALLALERKAEALTLLESIELESSPRSLELVVLRGELRAELGNLDGARADLSRAAGSGTPDALRERALYALAMTASRRSEHAEAQKFLRAYLADFPNGRFAAEARRSLEGNERGRTRD